MQFSPRFILFSLKFSSMLLEAAEPDKIANLLSTLYLDDDVVDVPKPDDAARRKEDRRRLGKWNRNLSASVILHSGTSHSAVASVSRCKFSRVCIRCFNFMHIKIFFKYWIGLLTRLISMFVKFIFSLLNESFKK